MKSCYGENFKLTIYGASHDARIGMILEGISPGLPVDTERLQAFLGRRAPGQWEWSTARKEADVPYFLSGLQDNLTDGNPIEAVIYNQNVKRSDYQKLAQLPRPGHADFTAWTKYGPDFDMSGGGPFSGRMTAPMCIAGGMCKQWLENRGIRIGAHIARIAKIEDTGFDPIHPDLDGICADFPVLECRCGEQMQKAIANAKADLDSVGGIIECAIVGLPAGLGSHLFGGLEGKIAQILYSIPGVKGVEFGLGFGNADHPGSYTNDPFIVSDGCVRTETNFCGGIQGGISNGMPILFRTAIKPTPSIGKPQKTVDLKTMEEVTLKIHGRHDPCIVPRAVPVVEAAAAIAIYDLILGGN